MSVATEDNGLYLVVLSRTDGSRIELSVIPSGSREVVYHQDLPPAYGRCLPKWDIAFRTGVGSKAHPLAELEYFYGPEAGAEILLGVFRAAERDYWALEEAGLPAERTFATMTEAHDALVICQERKNLE